jgi:hypothetical protein
MYENGYLRVAIFHFAGFDPGQPGTGPGHLSFAKVGTRIGGKSLVWWDEFYGSD